MDKTLGEYYEKLKAAQEAWQDRVEQIKPVGPLDVQIGGNHYKKYKIQPVEYIHANNIPFLEGNAIKYITRWKDKGGIADLEKAKHFIDLLIELENANLPRP